MSCCINPACNIPENSDSLLFCQSCGSELLINGHYRVVVKLGEGGFAKTYEANDSSGKAKVLKVLRKNEPKSIELLQREAQVLSQLSHSGIPSVEQDAYFTFLPKYAKEPLHCLAMEKVTGLDLQKYLTQLGRPIDQKLAVEWLIKLTQILRVVHHKDFLHRDIKPSNIMLKANGNLTLIDFGAVRSKTIQDSSRSGEHESTRIMSDLYTPFEQARGNPAPQSDFFALGRTFVYLLTGQELRSLYLPDEDRLLWRNTVPDLNPELADFLDQMMDPVAAQRPSSAEVVLQRLMEIQQGSSRVSLGSGSIETMNAGTVVVAPHSTTASVRTDPNNSLNLDSTKGLNSPVSSPKRSFPLRPILGILGGLTVLSILLFWLKGVLFASTSCKSEGSSPGSATLVQVCAKLSDIPNVPVSDSISYGGSTTFAPLRSEAIINKLGEAFPKFKLNYKEPISGKPGSGSGIKMLLDGQLNFSQSSRSLKPEELDSAKNKNLTLEEIPVAIDGIAIFVNPKMIDQGLKGLTLAQVKDIFSGKISNWKEVGGSNLKIVPFSRNKKAGGTVDFFIENVLEKQALGKGVQEVRDTTDAIRKVSGVQGGIGYASTSEVINQKSIRLINIAKQETQGFVTPCGDASCTTVDYKAFADGSYPITRRLFVIVKRNGQLDEQAGVAYANLLLSDEGQQLVKQAGFVPIR